MLHGSYHLAFSGMTTRFSISAMSCSLPCLIPRQWQWPPRIVDRGGVVVDLSADFRLNEPCGLRAVVQSPSYSNRAAQACRLRLARAVPRRPCRRCAQRKGKQRGGRRLRWLLSTATTLAAAPAVRLGLVDDKAPIVVDAISGVTGAGKEGYGALISASPTRISRLTAWQRIAIRLKSSRSWAFPTAWCSLLIWRR